MDYCMGTSLLGAKAGVPDSFLVVAYDSFSNRITDGGDLFRASLDGLSHYTVDAMDTGNGEYSAEYTVYTSGLYRLTITLNGRRVAFGAADYSNVTVTPGIAVAGFCTAEGNGVSSTMAGQTSDFQVFASDGSGAQLLTGGDAVVVVIRNSTEKDAILSSNGKVSSVFDHKDGSYSVRYKLTISGSYWLDVYVNNELLLNSPYPLTVNSGPAAGPNCYIDPSPTYVNNAFIATAGVITKFTIITRDALNNPATDGNAVFELRSLMDPP
jgi:hypothetical protein